MKTGNRDLDIILKMIDRYGPSYERVAPGSAIRNWALEMGKMGRPSIAVWGALLLGPPVEEVIWMVLEIINRQQFPCLIEHNQLPKWFEYWMNPRSMWRDVLDAEGKTEPGHSNFDVFRLSIHEATKLKLTVKNANANSHPTTSAEIDGVRRLITEFHERLLAATYQFNRDPDCIIDEFDEEAWEASKLAVKFFLLVWLPSLLDYGIPPDILIRDALQGKVSAIEDALRLDKNLRSNGELIRLIDEKRLAGETDQVRLINLALNSPYVITFPRARLKALYAGRLINMSIWIWETKCRTKWKFGPADIRKLFDSFAKDRGSNLRDEDIQKSEDSWRKQVSRYRKQIPRDYWDIFRLPNVRAG